MNKYKYMITYIYTEKTMNFYNELFVFEIKLLY